MYIVIILKIILQHKDLVSKITIKTTIKQIITRYLYNNILNM